MTFQFLFFLHNLHFVHENEIALELSVTHMNHLLLTALQLYNL